MRQNFGDRTHLDDAARVHNRDAIGDFGDNREIVGDPDQRGAGLGAQLLHLVDDLRLGGDIERGRRLVGNDQVRLVQHGDRDSDALAHAAGELMRIGAQALVRRRDADALERPDSLRARLRDSETLRCARMASTI